MTNDELERQGWDVNSANLPAIVIEMEDGTKIFPSCDPEGNGHGCLFAETVKGESFYVEEEKG